MVTGVAAEGWKERGTPSDRLVAGFEVHSTNRSRRLLTQRARDLNSYKHEKNEMQARVTRRSHYRRQDEGSTKGSKSAKDEVALEK
jgi:hypothetical protein